MVILQFSPTPARILGQASTITEVAWNSINGILTGTVERLPYIIAGILVLGIFYALARIAKGLFWIATRHTKLDQRLRILFSRLLAVFLIVLGVFTAISIIVPSFSFGNIIAGFGLTSVVIGFATKDIINNLLSGVMILWHRPFQIGDYLFFGTHQGKVEYIGVRATSLRKDDGELLLVPNGEMYTSALTIRGAGALRRMNLKFSIGYNADVERAKRLAIKAVEATDFVVVEPPPKAVVSELTSEGPSIILNFWINTDKSRPREAFDQAAVNVMRSLKGKGIELYPPGSLIVQRRDDAEGQPESSLQALPDSELN
jgi:small conductance mechanosensitive channel